jgi:hypothetical protein
MMFSQPYRSSTEEESSDVEIASSVASDAASKTTATDSWYDVKSDTEQQQIKQLEKIKNLDVEQETMSDDEDDDDDDDDIDPALITSIKDIYINSDVNNKIGNSTPNGNHLSDLSIQDDKKQQTQQTWTNPYWGANWKPSTELIQTIINGHNDNSDIER